MVGYQNDAININNEKKHLTLAPVLFIWKYQRSIWNTRISCFSAGNQIRFGKNLTVFRGGSLYLTSRTSGHCLLKGEVRSARILERANIELIVKQKDTLLCTGNCMFLLLLLLRTIWFCYLKGGRGHIYFHLSFGRSVCLSVGWSFCFLALILSAPYLFTPFAWKLPKLSVVVALTKAKV